MRANESNHERFQDWHRTPLRVPLFEVDLGQAVYHGNYFHLFELGREAFLRDLGYPYHRFMAQQLHLTLVEASCRYRRPLHYDDLIQIQTRVAGWRSRSLAFSQAIYRQETPETQVLCTEATLKMVCVRFTGEPTLLPPEFVDVLREWMERAKEGPAATRDKDAGSQ